jgi:Tfp pilus assembly protein PilV
VRRGFTLLEVVVALLVLEVAVVGVVGALVLASSTLARAEALERAVATTEGVLDSLARTRSAGADSMRYTEGTVSWEVDDSGGVAVRATDARGEVVLDVRSLLRPW